MAGCAYQTDDVDAILAAALLNTHAMSHAVTATAVTARSASRASKVQRPIVAMAGTTEDWEYFQLRWQDYKEATEITGSELIIQLLKCCEDDLRRDVMRTAGGSLTTKTEDEVLHAMRHLAVKKENTTVARVTLHRRTQDAEVILCTTESTS